MTTYTGRQTVQNGLYLNTETYTITTMKAAGPLPGTELQKFVRVPMIMIARWGAMISTVLPSTTLPSR